MDDQGKNLETLNAFERVAKSYENELNDAQKNYNEMGMFGLKSLMVLHGGSVTLLFSILSVLWTSEGNSNDGIFLIQYLIIPFLIGIILALISIISMVFNWRLLRNEYLRIYDEIDMSNYLQISPRERANRLISIFEAVTFVSGIFSAIVFIVGVAIAIIEFGKGPSIPSVVYFGFG